MRNLTEIKRILNAHKDEIKRKYKVKEIGIFGSFVRGEQRKDSDIDIFVEFEEVPDLFKFIELERYLEALLQVKVDLVRKKAIRKELKEQILTEAIII
ncbi:MAG: nucleotidyltransferase family protein [Candidatus Asgardarchaeia archaeon]